MNALRSSAAAAFIAAFLLCLAVAGPRADERPARTVVLMAMDGAIGPATTELLRRALVRAVDRQATALILRIDTPGGLDAATRDIDQAILGAPVPVVAWVSPGGARAASAGTYILYASHVAAMAPGTHLGAATPVAMGGTPAPSRPRPGVPATEGQPEGGDEDTAESAATAMERKVVNDSAAHIRSMAELRGRNAEWAERAVREGVSLTASEALAQGVVELIAGDLDELLQQLDGRTVTMASGEWQLRTAGADVLIIDPDWRHRLLSVIGNPSVAYLLLLAGLYGLLLEGYNPGSLVPGVVGVVCLLLAAYALQVLPVNYVGLALIVVGALLILAEAITPSVGVLGVGGLIALVLGSLVLFDSDVPGFGVSRGLIGGVALSTGSLMLLVLMLLSRSRRRPQLGGVEELLRSPAEVLEDFDGVGKVMARGEAWRAVAEQPLTRGQRVQVRAVEGLTLRVGPIADEKGKST